jgi:hypothetical protein
MKTIVAMAAIFLTSTVALGAAPTLSDIASCNEQAAAKTSASALPHPGRTLDKAPATPESTEPREQGARPGLPVPAVPGPSAERTIEGARPGEKTDPSGSIITKTPDPLVQGMDAQKADDPAYRAAYRDCMRSRAGR